MYSHLIVEHFTSPSFVGDIDGPSQEFEIGNSVCGDRIRVQLCHDGELINKVAFRAWGCATSVATADIFCESILDKNISDIASRDQQYIDSMLGELEPSQYHCVHILHELHERLVDKIKVGENA